MSNKENTASSNLCVASLRRRLLAMVYDVILVFALVFCAAMLYAAVARSLSDTSHQSIDQIETDQVLHELEPIDLGWGIGPYCASVAIGFYVFFWKKSGQTLGMRAWKLSLHDKSTKNPNAENKTPSIGQLILRCILAPLSLALFGLGYWFMFLNSERDTLHDKLSGTWVSMPEKK